MKRSPLTINDIRIILFIILMMLLPFILFSTPEPMTMDEAPFMMPVDTIGTDTSGIVLNYENDTLDEQFPAVFSSLLLNLTSIPADTVIILATPDSQLDLGDGAGVAVQLIFPPYPVATTPQEIKVKPVDDDIYEAFHSGTITFSISTDDTVYNDFLLPDVTYLIEDNDLMPGINFVYAADTFLTEGLTGVTLLLSLNSIPADTVYITADPDEQLRITGVPDEAVTFIFPPNSSSLTYQAFNVRAYDDTEYEGDHTGNVDMTVTTTDPVYSDFTLGDLVYDIIDNDSAPGINYSDPDTLILNEWDGEIDIVIALNSVPEDTVTIHVIPDDQLRIAAGPGEPYDMVFPPNTSALNDHVAVIKAYDDFDFEGLHSGTVSFEISTTDPDYAVFTIDPISIEINDNDLMPGIFIGDTSNLAGVEGDTGLLFSLALLSIPQSTVTINLDPDVQLDLGKGRDADVNFKFKADSALLLQDVHITIYDDVLYENDHVGKIGFEILTDDPNYMLFTIDTVVVEITDNDGVDVVNYDPAVWNLFPSVSAGVFSYNLPEPLSNAVKIFDAKGGLAGTAELLNRFGQLDLSYLSSGLYTLIAESGGKKYYTRIEILK